MSNERNTYHRAYYQKHKAKINARTKKYHFDNYEKRTAMVRLSNLRAKLKAVDHYSGGTRVCACCGEKNLAFLSLDHINNDGSTHRKIIGKRTNLARWTAKNNYPEGFQVLCFNCNIGKSNKGTCPHKNPEAYENI